MSTRAAEALDRGCAPWLLAAALAATAPHAEHQPLWLSALSAGLFTWGAWLWWTHRRLPGTWPLLLLVALATGGILFEFRTLLGRDAGVAMLVVFMALKLLELGSRRDATVVVTLAYFLLLTHYFYSQSIATGAWLLMAMTLATAALVRLHGGPGIPARSTLRQAGVLLAQSLPFMLALYLLFPRVSGPLWGLPQDAHAARTGLSEQMEPGQIASLAQSGEVAFRARFTGPLPPRDKLYWRGPVLENHDGRRWRPIPGRGQAPRIEALSPPVAYEITLEPHQQRWLLALDAPGALPANFGLAATLTATGREPLTYRQRFDLTATVDFRFNVDEEAGILRRNLALPPGFHPRTRALAEEWARAEADPAAAVGRALALFTRENFFYTLQPPLLGEQPVDEFLFDTRRGFCEHYAAAFVVLMRAAGIPARVVTGYQGGEANPVDGYLVVRQSDAHAWAEVWLAGRGGVRDHPTRAVSPARVEGGGATAVAAGEPLPAMFRLRGDWLRTLRYRWEALENSWNQQVIGYNVQRQRDLMMRFGMADPDWRSMGAALAGIGALMLAVLAAWALWRRDRRDAASRLWATALRKLARHKVNCAPWEPPLQVVRRIEQEAPGLAPAFSPVAMAYIAARYGDRPDMLDDLRAAVAHLP
ncbi:MAG: DUF3488 domain-containing protein [Betaproteobacteria bacterium]|nr:DUF3488 domain-containing protein [Betaproteobacteria bacterium]